jgi:hypothetical protein
LPTNGINPGIPGPDNLVRFYRSPSARVRQILNSCAQNGCANLPNPMTTVRLDRRGNFRLRLPAGNYVMLANSCGVVEPVTIVPGSSGVMSAACLEVSEAEVAG